MFIKAFSGGLKSSSKKGLLSAINELDDIADVNKLFKKSNISKKLASKLLDDSKFADALDKPYTKTASAAKEASSAVEKVAEASTSTANFQILLHSTYEVDILLLGNYQNLPSLY